MIQRGAMCSMVIVGLKYCGYKGECEHKRASAPAADQQPVTPSGALADNDGGVA